MSPGAEEKGRDRDTAAVAEDVVVALEQHCDAYRDLRELLAAQETALCENDLARLQKILAAQDEILGGIAVREEARHADHMLLLEWAGGEEIGLADILRRLNQDPGLIERATRADSRLHALTMEVRARNESNGELVRQALDFVNYSMETIRELAMDANTYRGPEKDSGEPPSMLMDKKF